MKIASATSLLILLGAHETSAFTQKQPHVAAPRTFSNQMANVPDDVETGKTAEATDSGAAGREAIEGISAAPVLSSMSKSMPFLARPPMLDGSIAGDVGFDPLGFVKNKEDLMNYREAEIKHARLAMLAAAGWPLSELLDRKLAEWMGMTPLVDASDRAPSILNGGLGKVNLIYWGACLAFAAAIDLYGIRKARSGSADYFPGNLGFDPLGLYPKADDKEGQMEMQLKEIKNGRLAMIAITAFAVQEFVQKIGVVDETPIFFKPISTVIHEYTNSGYIYH